MGEKLSNYEQTTESGRDFCPDVTSFTTKMGSVYEKTSDGRFARHKYDGTEHKQDLTMFIPQEQFKFREMTHQSGEKYRISERYVQLSILNPLPTHVAIVQPAYDKNGEIILGTGGQIVRSREDIVDKNNVAVGIFDNKSGERLDIFKVSLEPAKDAQVFEVRFGESPSGIISDHLGHPVSSISKKAGW